MQQVPVPFSKVAIQFVEDLDYPYYLALRDHRYTEDGTGFETGCTIYFRVKIVRMGGIIFNDRLAKGGNRAYDIYDDDYLDGFRYGAGLEAPVTSRVFVRLEFTHTEYDDYNVTTAHTNSDQMDFEPVQELARLGILYRF